MSARVPSRRSPARPTSPRNRSRDLPGTRPGRRGASRTTQGTTAASAASSRAGTLPIHTGRVLSARAFALLAVLLLLLIIAIPTINTGIRQIQQMNSLQTSNESVSAEIGDLKTKQKQLQEPEYVAQQARAQQQYVKPGDTAYVVVDDRTEAQRVAAGDPATDEDGQQANKSSHGRPWYVELLDSLKSVGLATQEN